MSTNLDASVGPWPSVESGAVQMDLRSMFGVLLRRWKLCAVIPILSVLLAALVLSFIAPLYKSTVEILVADPKRQTNAPDERRLSSLDVDAAAMASEVAVLSSKSVTLRAAQALNLDKDPEFRTTSRFSALLRRLGLTHDPMPTAAPESVNDTTSNDLDGAADELRRRMTVERLQFSYVLSVAVTSVDPLKAQRITAAVADAYLEDQRAAHEQAVQRSTGWLTGRLDEMRTRVLQTETEIEQLKAKSGLTDVGTGSNLNQQQTSEANSQLAVARADVVEKQARYEQARRVVSSKGDLQAIHEVVASPVIGQLRSQQTEVSRKEAELSAHFGERYPELVNVRSQLKDINKAIDSEVGRILANLQNAYEIAQQREKSVETALKRLTEERGQSESSVKLQELQRIDDADRKVYQNFLGSFNELTQRATLADVGARIITQASRPSTPSYPRSNLILAFALVLGGFIGLALAFVLEMLDATFKTSAQIEQTLGCPVLGMTLEVPARLRDRGRWRGRARARRIMARMMEDPVSRLSEAIRTTRLGLTMTNGDEIPKVVLVTSALPGEGKTTTSTLLATSSTTSGQRTLLVDCDMRHKALSGNFAYEKKVGLFDVLAGRAELADAVIVDESTGVAVLPAGLGAHSPADLLNSGNMRALIETLRQRYDFVVLDASPILAVIESTVLATMVDRILFVVQWDRTPRASAIEALKRLGQNARRITGVVMSRADHKRMRSLGYGYGSGFNYGSYHSELDKYYG